MQGIGALAGYPFSPYLCDGIGRRKTLFLGAVIMLCASALQTAAQSIYMFIGARFLIGLGLSFASENFTAPVLQYTYITVPENAAPLLVTELSTPEYRAPLTSLYSSLWYSGTLL